ncbi:MAG TPA: hypothetical protein VGR43_01730 [Dehalococcoidia bacterium]|nr:hypothetical protein [Dehalococcoidia bacterium]
MSRYTYVQHASFREVVLHPDDNPQRTDERRWPPVQHRDKWRAPVDELAYEHAVERVDIPDTPNASRSLPLNDSSAPERSSDSSLRPSPRTMACQFVDLTPFRSTRFAKGKP